MRKKQRGPKPKNPAKLYQGMEVSFPPEMKKFLKEEIPVAASAFLQELVRQSNEWQERK